MGLYVNSSQGLQMVSGRGKAEYGASTIRTGTFTNNAISGDSSEIKTITFDTPMPDAFYMLDISRKATDNAGIVCYTIVGKTANGFTIIIARPVSSSLPAGVFNATYTAFKLYTDNEYNGLLNNQRYSTDEIDTGKVWIDGKKIYRKVFNTTSPSSDGEVLVTTLPSDVEYVTKFEGTIRRTDLQFCALNWSYAGTTYSSTWIYRANSSLPYSVYQKMESTMRSKPEVIIVEYTKTT